MYILYVFEAKIRFSKIFIPNLGKWAGGGLNQDAPCLEACHLPPDAPRSIRPQCKLGFWCLELIGEKKIGVVKKIF